MAFDVAITDTVLMGTLLVIGLVVVYFMIREIRIMKTSNRKNELELEKDKHKLLQQHEESKKGLMFTRFSPEQIAEIRQVEDENTGLETNIYAKEKFIETRLTRLESLVKTRKLDNLLVKIKTEEEKVR
jgi:flagellar biosynthesis/type III secretory pathway M-ring protein FliF/YscJ